MKRCFSLDKFLSDPEWVAQGVDMAGMVDEGLVTWAPALDGVEVAEDNIMQYKDYRYAIHPDWIILKEEETDENISN